ncbi:MAG: hypothetical protein Tsb0017_09940 [Geothermobacteraceae bacterium]
MIISLLLLLLPALAVAAEVGDSGSSCITSDTGVLAAQVDDAGLKNIRGRFHPVTIRENGPVTTTADIILWDEGHHPGSITRIEGMGNTAVTILERHSY